VDRGRYTALFHTESRGQLEQCAAHLLAWEQDPQATVALQGLFRAVHTLKGMAGSLGFTNLTALAHGFEDLLAGLRDRSAPASGPVIQLGFDTVDRLEQGVELAVAGQDDQLAIDDLLTRLVSAVPAPAADGRGGEASTATAEYRVAGAVGTSGFPVRVRLRADTPMPAARAAVVLREAERLGTVTGVTPPVEDWMREGFGGDLVFRLDTELPPEEIRSRIGRLPGVGEVLAGAVAVPRRRTMRVEVARLDTMVHLAGELVRIRNRFRVVADARRDPDLEAVAERLERAVGRLQEEVFGTRLAPVAEVLDRFPRTVRDLARQLGKRARLHVEGEAIELDRAILDELADPLLHLVRNALDHGLESPEDRATAGKPAEGMVAIRARRERNSVVIEVVDDGRGVDREAVRTRAGGQVGVDGDDTLLAILAQPGFSTAAGVTEVSGRGVGIDAVAEWTRRFGGALALSSTPGHGTTVVIRLPLTVSIVPALLLDVAEHRLAVPLTYVAETSRLGRSRGAPADPPPDLPLLDLGLGQGNGPSGARRGVVLDVAGRRGVLPVDRLLGQEDIVITPLAEPRDLPPWVNGATILADGLPALVVDPSVLVTRSTAA